MFRENLQDDTQNEMGWLLCIRPSERSIDFLDVVGCRKRNRQINNQLQMVKKMSDNPIGLCCGHNKPINHRHVLAA